MGLSQPVIALIFLVVGLLLGGLSLRARTQSGGKGSPRAKAYRRTSLIFLMMAGLLLVLSYR
jgi:hypothetical protein